MKEYDFLLGYEHKNRELDALCLLAIELERRGYSTFIFCGLDWRLKNKLNYAHGKVLIIPWAYDERNITYFAGTAFSFDKVVNLQWEQALTREQEEDPLGAKSPKGMCKNVVHISWGEANYKRLTEVIGIRPDNVFITGNITLDYLSTKIKGFYRSRESLFREYGIPTNKKILLFIASFKAAFLNKPQLEESIKEYGDTRRIQHEYAKRSYVKIVEWLKYLIDRDDDIYLIYRPHPGEDVDILKNDFAGIDRVSIISEESIKQWILVADVVSTWYSTSIVEVYAAGKPCIMPVPYELPRAIVSDFFEDACVVRCEEDFYKAINNKKNAFPISKGKMEKYYSINDSNSYQRVADVVVKVYLEDKYNIDKGYVDDMIRKRYHTDNLLNKCKRRVLSNRLFYFMLHVRNSEGKVEKNELVSYRHVKKIKKHIALCLSD